MQSLEFTGLNLEFYWIRIYNSGSGSRQKFRIHADPDPQHWKNVQKSYVIRSRSWKRRQHLEKKIWAWAAPKQAGSETLVRVWF